MKKIKDKFPPKQTGDAVEIAVTNYLFGLIEITPAMDDAMYGILMRGDVFFERAVEIVTTQPKKKLRNDLPRELTLLISETIAQRKGRSGFTRHAPVPQALDI